MATTPSLSDGIVLTGFSHNASWQGQWLVSTVFHLASLNQPARFGNRSTGYVTWGDEYANQYGFLHYPNFDPTVLAAAEAGKYPFTIGEVLTGPPVVPVDAPDFKGPVLVGTITSSQMLVRADAVCR